MKAPESLPQAAGQQAKSACREAFKASCETAGKPLVQNLFQHAEKMEESDGSVVHTGHQRWMIPYADLLTLLLGLFLVLLATVRQPPVMPKPVAKPAAAHTAKAAANQMQRQLKMALAAKMNLKDVDIRPQPDGVTISLKEKLLFSPGSATLSKAAQQRLNRVAHALQGLTPGSHPMIRVEGHTDNTPIHTAQYPSNWELSTARATTILRYLAAQRIFPPETLSAAGYGEFKPVSNNSTIEGKQKNRRVDIVVVRPLMTSQTGSGHSN